MPAMTVQPGLFPVEYMPPPVTEMGAAKAGPKGAADVSPLPWNHDHHGVESLDWFTRRYLLVPRGYGAGEPMRLRPWQLEMAATLYGDRALAVWVLPRGNGKSGIAAAIALHSLFMPGRIGRRIAVVAQDERSARRLLHTAARMVELHPDLAARARIYRDRITVPGTDAELVALPAEAHRVEGSDLDLAILDEVGFMPRDTFDASLFSVGKVEGGRVLAIGTPSPSKFRESSPLWDLVTRGRADVDDEGLALVEYGADPAADIHDPATWAAANPAYGDWLTEKSIRAQSPPTTRELEFRRARLGQWTDASSEPAFAVDAWRACGRKGVRIPKGTRVVLALDGSMNSDSTGIVVGTVSSKPHFEVGGLWEPSRESEGYEVSHLEVEDRIVDLATRFHVVEVIADPFRWQRTLQVLEEHGLPVAAFPHTARRLTPATVDLRAAVAAGLLTHGDDPDLNRHILRASVEESARGIKLGKPSKHEKIDLAACLIMAHSRCVWLGSKTQKRKRKVKAYR